MPVCWATGAETVCSPQRLASLEKNIRSAYCESCFAGDRVIGAPKTAIHEEPDMQTNVTSNQSLRLSSGKNSWLILSRLLGCMAVLFLMLAAKAGAQVATGDILGTVTDSTGSAVAGASVQVQNIGTGQARTFNTKASGEYVFSGLQPGTYQVTITSPTFKTFDATNVVLGASDRVRIDAPLRPGSVEERVEVSSTPTSLQTDTTTVGSTITEKTLLDAPLNGRNFIGLVQVQAGVNAGSPNSLSSGSNIVDRRQSSSISANGQEELFNNNMLDGLDNNSRAIGTLLLRPSVEAISQVRTDINLYTAEVGRTGGAAINVISKSGDNQIHGSAYEFFRNDITDAHNFFATGRKPEQRQNQYGGSLGGPIFRDRTFFFLDYEGLRLINGNNSVYVSTVPTAAEQATPGYLNDIINPFTKAPVANIPTANLDPTALAYFKLFPLPNIPGAGAVNNFLYNPSASLYSSLGDVRIDHHFSRGTLYSGAIPITALRRIRLPIYPQQMAFSLAGLSPVRSPAITSPQLTMANLAIRTYSRLLYCWNCGQATPTSI